MIIPIPNPLAVFYAALSCLPNRDRDLERRETAAVFMPVYNEEREIQATIQAVLAQTRLPDLLVISENGSTDTSLEIILKTLTDNGGIFQHTLWHEAVKVLEYHVSSVRVLVICHTKKTGKAASVNFARPLMQQIDRVASIDSDTVVTPRFLELMMGGFYWLVQRQRGFERQYEIHEKCIVGGFVDSKKEPGTGLMGEVFHRARMASQDTGQYLYRMGQNRCAVFVAPGCAYAVRVKDWVIPERTVTEDLDFTWQMQLRPVERTKLTCAELDEMGFSIDGVPLGTFLQQRGQTEVTLVKTRKVYCVPGAIAYAITPGTLSGWLRQLNRWDYGFQQNLVLHNSKVFGNKHLALVSVGNQITYILACVLMMALPFQLLLRYVTLETGLQLLLAIAGECMLFLYLAELRKHYGMRKSRVKAIGFATLDVLLDAIPMCVCMPVDIYLYLKSVGQGMRDAVRGHTGKWEGVWVRPVGKVADGKTS